ncbi:hypothetical protein ADLECEL_14310 [Adlercreutzia equolifaciens subsp. celatus]|uniref:Uncharacterized protein n=2 Tax=Adlercreutzia equolifaciens TaxID=446660 RepID=A0A3N0ASU5_9ACTN|nr:hypothetical protein [Adlercreutzia equolifaciens]MCP2077345.1 hypothetical protein [Adlercreutzia equolifaciens subsp. celatus DSM 18785]RFT92547.1 hypothetical protein DX904_06360 [Adlercreutzia equolifaciens subsp. celatus]RNL37923.1 hypothetical protein DMP10_06575 [Adlercreutzia equolifaciens subsp. celatus DSM 18785]BCS57546.1 hypothetical protein ADLECEL_14310 [Adlercreutzia equolifaciens subsp. celatus]
MSGPPRSCRWCANMTCGDANWCEALKVCVTDRQLPSVRNCPSWEGHFMAADSFEVWEEPSQQKNSECDGQTRLELE